MRDVSLYGWAFSAVVTLVIMLFAFFCTSAIEYVKVQKIWKLKSWVWYVSISFIAGPLIALAPWLYYNVGTGFIFYLILLNLCLSLAFLIAYQLVQTSRFILVNRFASDSVGVSEDKFGYASSAKNIARGFLEQTSSHKDHPLIEVIALYGEHGFGKSSYARMIVESLYENDVKILYTYVSLTETNEASGFSRLFDERWTETLAKRYPRIDRNSTELLQSVLQEQIPWYLKMFSFVNVLSSTTRTRVAGEGYDPDAMTCSSTVSAMFGNVEYMGEKLWIIVIDELERAQFDEIYRTIEVLERFKNEGRTGMPTKVVFLLCISEPDFSELLNKFKDSDPRAHQLKGFFQDGKNITRSIFLPPISSEQIRSYYAESISSFFGEILFLDSPDFLNRIYLDTNVRPDREFLNSEDSLDFVLSRFAANSLRVFSRALNSLRFSLLSWRTKQGNPAPRRFRFSDILMMEFIKIKYPYLVEFFRKTVYLLIDERSKHFYELDRIKKKNLVSWIEDVVDTQILNENKEEIERIVGAVCFKYILIFKNGGIDKAIDTRLDTLADPRNLRDWMASVSDGGDGEAEIVYRKNRSLFHDYEQGVLMINEVDNPTLIEFARWIADRSNDWKLLHNLLEEFKNRMNDGRVERLARNVGDTSFDDVTFTVIYLITRIIEIDGDKSSISFVLENIIEILDSNVVPYGQKFQLLNSFVNNKRGIGSEIHQRFELVYSRVFENNFAKLQKCIIRLVQSFEDSLRDETWNIYEQEENFFYTLYQSWDGDRESSLAIELRRLAARRSLVNYPDAILTYWTRYRFESGWKGLNDVKAGDPFFQEKENIELCLTLNDLITATKQTAIMNDDEMRVRVEFWEKIKETTEYRNFAKIVDDKTTLFAALVERKILLNRHHLTQLIEADNGKNWWTPELFAAKTLPQLPPELHIVAQPPAYEANYNCFAYAFGLHHDPEFLGGKNPVQQEFVQWLIATGELVEQSHASTGSLVLYSDDAGEITHSGIMQDASTVISKWMWGPTIVHALMDVPASFGATTRFFAAPDTARIKDKYLEYKATGVEIQPIG